MSGRFVVRPLCHSRIAEAFPIVSILEPRVGYEEWRDFAEANIARADSGQGQGMVAVETEQGHIFGLSSYRVSQDLKRQRIFVIENFAVVDLLGSSRAARALLEELEQLAHRHRCHCLSLSLLNPGIRISLRDREHRRADFFSHLGFHVEPLRHRKCFDAQAGDLQAGDLQAGDEP